MASAHSYSLDDELQYVKGVGPSFAQTLAKMGLHTVGDVLRRAPRRYEDRSRFRKIIELVPGDTATIQGRVVAAEYVPTSRKNFNVTRVLVDDGTAVAQITFFQQPYLLKMFSEMARTSRWVVIYGQAKRSGFGPIEMERVEWEELSEESDGLSTNRIVPIYPATEGVGQRRLRKIVDSILAVYLDAVEEPLPEDIVRRHRLMEPKAALRNVHFPGTMELLREARRRLVFEEFFLLQVGLARRRLAVSRDSKGYRFSIDRERLHSDLRQIVPFELTGAQTRAVEDIAGDLSSGHLMNRLVQGDVGSGKTMVAIAALFMAVENGYQAALMAPTEILAQQHAIVLRRLLEPAGITVDLASGSQGVKEKRAVRERLMGGQSRIAVGTHALIQEGIEFAKLGLVIIDEQHRFGVLQRQALHLKGENPHVLVMTATPIPRTLTLTIYGDLDTSIIDELPPGRKPIRTHWKRHNEAGGVYSAARKLLEQGRQVYVVCPLVEESDKLQARAATKLAEQMREEIFPEYRVGLLHGQLKSDEKDEVMRQFKAHDLDILVATTVIEVGIDVPNASAIVIEDADRFGLAQLHQLRGRVGRGEHASYCVLVADPKTDDGRARMQVMVETQDGFRIAEEDLKLRGPGEFFGTRQSGLPEFIFGDLIADLPLMDEARRSAFDLVAADPNLQSSGHVRLKAAVERSKLGFELIQVS